MRNLISLILLFLVIPSCAYTIRDEGYQIIEASPIAYFDTNENNYEINGVTIYVNAISTPINSREMRSPYRISILFRGLDKITETVSICNITIESLMINGFPTMNQKGCIEKTFDGFISSINVAEGLNASFENDEKFRVKFSIEITKADQVHKESLNILFAPKLLEFRHVVP